MSSNTSDPLELLQCLENERGFRPNARDNAHLIRMLWGIRNKSHSFCVLEDRDLSLMYHYLDTLHRVEEEYGSFRVFSDNTHLIITAKRIQQGCYSFRVFIDRYLCFHANEYPSLKGPDITSTLERTAGECDSLYMALQGYHFSEEYLTLDTLQQIEEDWGSFRVFADEYLSKSSHLLQMLQRIKEECGLFCEFLAELQSRKYDLLQSLQHIEQVWGSFCMYSGELRIKISNFLEIPARIEEECSSLFVFLKTYPSSEDSLQRLEHEGGLFNFSSSAADQFRLLKRDFKFLSIILHLHNFKDEPDVLKEARALFQFAKNDLIRVQTGQRYYPTDELSFLERYHHIVEFLSYLQYKFQETKSEIRRTRYSFPEISFQLLANKDGIAIPNFEMEFIDKVVENLSDLLSFNDPCSLLCIGEPMMGQIEKTLKELKFLKSFVCFVSDRCIEPQVLNTFFTHVVEVAWHTTVLAWLYLPSHKGYEDSSQDESDYLFSELRRERIQPIEPSICKIYIGVLQALKLVRSQWYPIIQIKYIVGCEVGFVDTLLHCLEELPISSDFTAIKETLQEMLNILKSNLTDLPVHALVFHLQHIDSVIVDVGLRVYSITFAGETNQELILDFSEKIQSIQAVIYLITRRSFLLQSNLPRNDGLGSMDFILDNLKELLSLYSNSIDSVKSQLQTIQNELKCFQAVVEKQDELQHFAASLIDLAYEVEHISDACQEKDIPECCIFLWILHIEEDIRLLMAEVAEIQEKNVSDLVLPNNKDAPHAHTSSQFAKNPDMNEEMVGLMDVMDKLRGKLIEGSSNLDVISIVGMPGAGKTTLANKLYFDEPVVRHFDIRAQCCVSQEYTRKDLLVAILGDITGETAKLDKVVEDVLADKLRKHLFGMRYLILIDDIWQTSAWDDLSSCFHDANNGSRIILTTRHYDVASHAIHGSDPLVLRLLSSDESWTLLQNKVFTKESCPLSLRDVGKSIAQKCGGLPLSIVLVGGILARMEKEKYCWEQVETNLGLHIQAQSEHAIDLSYQDLPHHLRICFLYFGVFSEDKEIQVSKLTWLWISEGFVKAHMEKLLEDIAKDYLENLIGRNLVMVAKRSFDGQVKACRIHDLLLEFCKEKAKSENFLERIKWDRGMDPSHVFPSKHKISRRLSLHSRCSNLVKWCSSFSHVRSFQFREARKTAFHSIDHASYTFKRFKFLRVLDIEFTVIDSFPQELTLLRYLAFRTAEDTISLPANLWNLETLIVQGIRGQVSLPDTIWNMVKLRHLHIYDQAFFILDNEEELLERAFTMDDLQTISSACFSCVDNADKILARTPNLQKLRCDVSKLGGSLPAFNNLTMLKMLKISSGPTLTSINQLKLPSHLKKLTLSNFRINLNEATTLSNLEVLKLQGVTIGYYNTWKVNDEQFVKLRILKVENSSFSEWDVSDDAFPYLEHLVLKRCRYLRALPSCLGYMPSLKSIKIKLCKQESLAESALVIKEMQVEDMGYSDFKVFIHK